MNCNWTEENQYSGVGVQDQEQDQHDGREQEEADARAEEEEQEDEVFPLPTNNQQVLSKRSFIYLSSSSKMIKLHFVQSSKKNCWLIALDSFSFRDSLFP